MQPVPTMPLPGVRSAQPALQTAWQIPVSRGPAAAAAAPVAKPVATAVCVPSMSPLTGVRTTTPCGGAATAAKLQIVRPIPLQLQHVAQPVAVAQPTSPTSAQGPGPNSPTNHAQRQVVPHTPHLQMQPCPQTPQQSHKQVMMTSQPVLPKQAPPASTPQVPKAGFRLAAAVSPGVGAISSSKPTHAAGTSSVAFGGAKAKVAQANPFLRIPSPLKQRVPVRPAQAVIFNPAVRSPSGSYRSAAIPVSNTAPPPRQVSMRVGDGGSAAIGQGQHSPRAAALPPTRTEVEKDLGASTASGPQGKQNAPAAVLRLQQAKRMVLAASSSPQPPVPRGFLMPAMCVRVAGQSPLPRARHLQATLNPPQETAVRSRRRSMSQQPQRPQDKSTPFVEVEVDVLAASVPGAFHSVSRPTSRPTSPASVWRPPPEQQQAATPPHPARPLVQAPDVQAAAVAQQAKSPTQWLAPPAPASSKHQQLVDWLRPPQGGSSSAGSLPPSSPTMLRPCSKDAELEPCNRVAVVQHHMAKSEASLPVTIVQEPHPEPKPETAVPTTSTEAVSTTGTRAVSSSGASAAKPSMYSIHTPAIGGGLPLESSPVVEQIDVSPEVNESSLGNRRPPELRPELQKLELPEARSAPTSARSQEGGVLASARSQQSLPSSAPTSGKSDKRPFMLLPESPQKSLMRPSEEERAEHCGETQYRNAAQLEEHLLQEKHSSPLPQHQQLQAECGDDEEQVQEEQQTIAAEPQDHEELDAEAFNEASMQSEQASAEPEEVWDGGFSWSMEQMHPMVTEKERDYIQQCTEALGQDVLLAGGLDEYLLPDSSLRLQLLGLRGAPQDGGTSEEEEADEEPSTPRRMVRRCLEAKLQRFARSGSDTVFVQPGYLMTQGGKKIVKMKLLLNNDGSNISVCWDWDVKLEHAPPQEM